jgi:hypothetical protein
MRYLAVWIDTAGVVKAVKGVHRACRNQVKQGNNTDRESVSSPTLHMLYFTVNLDQSKCL